MSMETTTQTLTDFLLARIAEDEAVARETDDWDEPSSLWPCETGYGPTAIAIPTRRVLAECEAKRRIVALHTPAIPDWQTGCTHPGCEETHGPEMPATCPECSESQAFLGCETLTLLALPYAEHPDFREEWRA